jgi:hypothetical protein
LRILRGWTRTQLLRASPRAVSDDPYYESVSEKWLARLGKWPHGQVPRTVGRCRALRCNHRERKGFPTRRPQRARRADQRASPAAQARPRGRAAYAETGGAERDAPRERTSALNELELFEIVSAAEQVIARRQRAGERIRYLCEWSCRAAARVSPLRRQPPR